MVTWTLHFLAGVLLLQWQAQLPSIWWAASIPLLVIPFCYFRPLRPLLAAVFGFSWALLHAHMLMDMGIAHDLQGEDLYVEGVVVSVPERTIGRTRFELQVEKMDLGGEAQPSPGRIRLGWYKDAPEIRAGQRWGLVVRLRQPHGLANPGGFDYVGWLFQRGVRASGYVRESERNRWLGEGDGLVPIQRWRQEIRDRINAMSDDHAGAALLNGLVVGDRSGITKEQWRLFASTGTSHLIAISGLHIGIVFGLMFFIVRWVWGLSSTMMMRLPAQQAAAIFGLLAATIYAAMAGFAIPTQRALIMLLVFVAGYLLRRPPSPSRALAAALLLVVLWDPLAVLSIGFWLSFAAVAAIFIGISGRVGRIGWMQQWGRVQWMIALGLAPLLLAAGLQVSLLAPMINLVAVPLFSFFVVPLCLLTTIFIYLYEPLGSQMLILVTWVLTQGVACLDYLSGIHFVVWTAPELPNWVWPPALIGGLMLLSPRGVPARWMGLIFLAPMVIIRPTAPEYGAANLTVLDVGQGLALALRTQRHTMLYDLGPRFSDDFDTGSAVVLPYLRSLGIGRVDKLLLSNGDMDHAGGLSGVLGQIEIDSIMSGEPLRLDVAAGLCHAGEAWSWDGVDFRVLHPSADGSWRGNNASCVLQIEVAGRSLLIPGDIDKSVEQRLIEQDPDRLRSDLVIVPHHGSRSSSSSGFIRAVSPGYALVSSGFRNRYGFPAAEVVKRWRSAGAKLLNTAELGAIELEIAADGVISVPVYHRLRRMRYWHKPLIPRM